MAFWTVVLVAATSIHVGFELTVSTLVYPALVRVAPVDFARAHAAHSRATVPLVAVVYGLVVVTGLGAVVDDPGSVPAWLAGVASAVAVGVTALRAAPLHGRLGRLGPDPGLLRSLLRADRVRTVAAVLAAAAAVVHALPL